MSAPQTAGADPMIGRTIDAKYEVLRILGEGGMGAVYLAKHLVTGRQVAVKVVLGVVAQNAAAIDRFLREARVGGSVDSQHVVQVLDAGKDPSTGNPYIAMELLSGEDLGQLVKRVGALAPETTLRIVGQACAGLAKAHAQGIIHRDIKPANIFLANRDGEIIVKILDFGIAKDAKTSRMTKTGQVLGSPAYMSPEQIMGDKNIDPRTDLWSLGAAMYQMLAGRVPYEAETAPTMIGKIISGPPPELQSVAAWVPIEIATIVARAMQHDLAQRFQSAQQMQEAIKALLAGGSLGIQEAMLAPLDPRARETIASRQSSVPSLARSAPAFDVTAPASVADAGPPRSKSSAVVPIAALIAIAVVGAGAFGVYELKQRADEKAVQNAAASTSAPLPSPEAHSAVAPIADAPSPSVSTAPAVQSAAATNPHAPTGAIAGAHPGVQAPAPPPPPPVPSVDPKKAGAKPGAPPAAGGDPFDMPRK